MNRVEKILESVREKLSHYPDDKSWVETYRDQVKFFEWLLEETDELPLYELHEERVHPSVWGMGDVTYHLDVQLNKLTSRDSPIVLIFNYLSSKQKVTGNESV